MKPAIRHLRLPAALALAALLGACVYMPTGPSVMALPGTGKSFDQFRADDANCRQFAFQQSGGVSAGQASTASAVGSAAVGTALGAAAGAAINGGTGAAVGAGAGLLAGSVVGAGAAQGSAYDMQRRYDYGYLQCMYASGNRVPVPGGMSGGGGGYGGDGYGGAPRTPPPMPPAGVQPPPPRY
ncbi:YMGG-like glycine zipper-containing protein [Burkholderia pseudomultivorans]|uniref:Glycine-zipper-containing OmpA-like membrane domain-containing protein n=2 Tax=Burkholderia pseudomultivorans TaxID=1207504 RepID=A0A6P2L219_9BURK|nr:YMGG-like glycine zipper-containing protein [Burkholderia pseudomultivorans]MDR8727218.1 hypothetical protein [Burkholderia pseudomultivorans]MDR8734870.1 hypothetical protein [Burkholderia pseudomultivorans]MDR8751949.1 hypothetical protein [Burkholderia pseudomultivorans]MDR8777275.1 hypothetical protein [Burkholderia pseudomultivorans]MDR8829093.1 hypothetical protein [Burkholderia pseudomultivorans]